MEAKVLMLKCEKHKKPFGVRVQKENDDWLVTWAFKIDENMASKEGFDSQSTLTGSFITTDEYPGCPYCGALSFFQCGMCDKLTCYNGEVISECSWCSNKSEIQTVDSLELKGGGF